MSSPAPSIYQVVPQVSEHVQEGPYCLGLIPHVPMLTPFKLVVSYRHYRLKNTRAVLQDWESELLYKFRRRFDSLYPTFQVFDGSKPIKLLEFLTVLRKVFDALRASEALAPLTLAYNLDGQAKTQYTALTTPGVRTTASTLGVTWPSLVDSLIKRYLTDDVLQAAYDKITDAKLKLDEDENTFTDRLVTSARECCNVFEDRELVNYFVRGLLPSKRDTVTERVKQLPFQEQGDITAARRVAQAEGNTYRERRSAETPSTPKSRSKSPAMFITDDIGADNMNPASSPGWSPIRRGSCLKESFWALLRKEDSEKATRIADSLQALLFIGQDREDKKTRMAPTSPMSSASLEKMMNRAYVEVPKLTESQYRDAITVIPADYWSLTSCTCKTDGHKTFSCSSLTVAQRLYFVYCYFLYMCKGHPAMRDWLHQRHAKRPMEQERGEVRQDHKQDRTDRRPARPASPGSGFQGMRYQNRLKGETNKNVHFNKQGVYLATQVGDAPRAPEWQQDHESDSSDSGNGKGQG